MNTDLRDWFALTDEDCRQLEDNICYPACDNLAQLARTVLDAGLAKDYERIKSRIRLLISSSIIIKEQPEAIRVTTSAQLAVESIRKEAMSKGWSEVELTGQSNDYRQLSFAQLFIEGSDIVSVDEDKITIMTPTGITQNVWKQR